MRFLFIYSFKNRYFFKILEQHWLLLLAGLHSHQLLAWDEIKNFELTFFSIPQEQVNVSFPELMSNPHCLLIISAHAISDYAHACSVDACPCCWRGSQPNLLTFVEARDFKIKAITKVRTFSSFSVGASHAHGELIRVSIQEVRMRCTSYIKDTFRYQ